MDQPPGLDEEHAIALLKQGNLAGMETLVHCYQVKAVYAAYLIVQDMALAEDVVQTAFLQAAKKIGQFDASRPFGAWFLRSVIHAAIKAANRQRRFVPLDGGCEADNPMWASWLTDPGPGPEAIVESEETRQIIWRALQQLPVEQRAAVIMHHFLGMKEVEMIQEFNRPASTVRWWLRAARGRLKGILLLFWKSDHAGLEEERQD